jgi:hypothetical protein
MEFLWSEGKSDEAYWTDRQGAQLSQECPLPIHHQPIGTNNRTAQCRCLQCGRLFRLDLAIQVVSHPPKIVSCEKRMSQFVSL